MKKLLFLLFLLPVLASAQSRLETQAKSTAAKMTEVLSLTTEQADNVYKAELSKVKDVVALRSSGEDVSVFRPKVSARNKAFEKELEGFIGAEKVEKWKKYQEEEKAKKQ
jgi:hypothetical protein